MARLPLVLTLDRAKARLTCASIPFVTPADYISVLYVEIIVAAAPKGCEKA